MSVHYDKLKGFRLDQRFSQEVEELDSQYFPGIVLRYCSRCLMTNEVAVIFREEEVEAVITFGHLIV